MPDGDRLRLDQALVARALARSRTVAQRLTSAGEVLVDGVTVTKPSTPVAASAKLEVLAGHRWVSRAAHKLLGALDAFPVDPAGRVAVDLGASTGGFTEVLLARGASRVFAVDVGHGQFQLDRADPRITLREGLNVRALAPDAFEPRPSLVVADLSFISLTLVFGAVRAAVDADAEWLVLIKPQFEVGKGHVREGIVVDPVLRAAAVRGVLDAAWSQGLGTSGLAPSPVFGTHGNTELLAWLRPGGAHPTEWDARIHAIG